MRFGGQKGLPDTRDGRSVAQGVGDGMVRCDGAERELCATTEQLEGAEDEDAGVDGRKHQQELQNAGHELPGARNSSNSERLTCFFKGVQVHTSLGIHA
ncbi:hypothetical protein DVH05_010545 [Phytophthora capsici]|nr:hypothetical protein DVH05_010545 [Phytophthora capsici]